MRCDRCGQLARIESSSQEAESYKKLYCSCKNPECGHSFVMDLTFSHTLSPSALDLPDPLRKKIQSMGHAEQLELFAGLGVNL
ncbi:MAG: ogr/Delta-like zinc finger family protein [Maridesulfovibrio ferrireducens]|nr:ogr/Delta-like zinc finger family protein [Maridesulfovibrio ferrireducens]